MTNNKRMPRNMDAFERLAERYETISITEIEFALDGALSKSDYERSRQLCALTGFGRRDTCTLCAECDQSSAKSQCATCAWSQWKRALDRKEDVGYASLADLITGAAVSTPCHARGTRAKTYEAIMHAQDAEGLLAAYRERAKAMRGLIESLKKEADL